MTLVVKPKTIFGKIHYTPLNDTAALLLKLMKRKAFSISELDELVEVGFYVSVLPE